MMIKHEKGEEDETEDQTDFLESKRSDFLAA